jgi:hypothetical protein
MLNSPSHLPQEKKVLQFAVGGWPYSYHVIKVAVELKSYSHFGFEHGVI